VQIAIVGGGAAGFFGAIACARANPQNEISIFERGSQFLSKVRISGGGRCNVTNICSDPKLLIQHYPRGGRALISPFHQFSSNDVVAWFQSRGIRLKTEPDGRVFPVTDSSATIIECLLNEARGAGVRLFARRGVDRVTKADDETFQLTLTTMETIHCHRLMLATGGARSVTGARIAASLGHTILPPVPSLFSLHIATPWTRTLPGVSIADVELSVSNAKLRERGPLLITHHGLSGPVVLRLSAWGARLLHDLHHHFTLRIDWLPNLNQQEIRDRFQSLRGTNPNRSVTSSPFSALPARLWEQLTLAARIKPDTRWTNLARNETRTLIELLKQTELEVNGQSLNKDEFVTCGGVSLREVDFTTMESRITPHLYFAGELLDLDGLTGGFNFQAAWTTGWIAGHAMAGCRPPFPP